MNKSIDRLLPGETLWCGGGGFGFRRTDFCRMPTLLYYKSTCMKTVKLIRPCSTDYVYCTEHRALCMDGQVDFMLCVQSEAKDGGVGGSWELALSAAGGSHGSRKGDVGAAAAATLSLKKYRHFCRIFSPASSLWDLLWIFTEKNRFQISW